MFISVFILLFYYMFAQFACIYVCLSVISLYMCLFVSSLVDMLFEYSFSCMRSLIHLFISAYILTTEHQTVVDEMIRYYNGNYDNSLDSSELTVEHRTLHVDSLHLECHLMDLIRHEDTDGDSKLHASELYAAFGK